MENSGAGFGLSAGLGFSMSRCMSTNYRLDVPEISMRMMHYTHETKARNSSNAMRLHARIQTQTHTRTHTHKHKHTHTHKHKHTHTHQIAQERSCLVSKPKAVGKKLEGKSSRYCSCSLATEERPKDLSS